jgi:hypothetical protein
MNPLARFFLRAKHWQMFILMTGPFVLGIAIEFNSDWHTMPPPEGFGTSDLKSALLWLFFMFFYLAWLWAAGTFLNSIVQPTLRMKIGFFRFSLIYPALYFFVFWAVFHSSKPVVLALIFPLHAFATFCMFYLLYFVSKSLVSAETGRPAGFLDYVGVFFSIWFFPVGIWTIQPRVIHLYEKSLSPTTFL